MNSKLRWSTVNYHVNSSFNFRVIRKSSISLLMWLQRIIRPLMNLKVLHTRRLLLRDIPYASVKWYVDGSLKETDYASG